MTLNCLFNIYYLGKKQELSTCAFFQFIVKSYVDYYINFMEYMVDVFLPLLSINFVLITISEAVYQLQFGINFMCNQNGLPFEHLHCQCIIQPPPHKTGYLTEMPLPHGICYGQSFLTSFQLILLNGLKFQ